MPFRPASSGPVRYWQDRIRIAVKAAIAAVAAWTLARYAAGQPDPYFAPLAALLGIYPTVARSLREGVQYLSGFLLGAALAIPVGALLGPGIAGIAVIVVGGVLLASWRRLGDQATQVTFTALFVLLLGGDQPLHYVTHRMIEVAIGLLTGLVVNVVIFPPLQLRPAEHAVRRWGEDVGRALEVLGDYAADPSSGGRFWPQHDRQLTQAAEQARMAVRHARESLRWNPRAKVNRSVPRPDGATLDTLEALTARTRAVARSLLDAVQDGHSVISDSVLADYGRLLHILADPVRKLADQRTSPPSGSDLTAARNCQDHLERHAAGLPDRSDERGTAERLARLTADVIREISPDER